MKAETNSSCVDSSCPACLPRIWRSLPVLAAVALLAFAAGLVVRGWLDRRRDHRPAGMTEFLKHLSVAADLGVIAVDRQKLDELVCISSEASWEDDEDSSQSERDPR